MENQQPVSDWIPLVTSKGDGFALSEELLGIVGSLGWGRNLWEVRAFVARLITHWEDGYEHFLDNENDQGPLFHISKRFCDFCAERFRSEFLPLDSAWYHDLAVAKLLTMRVPVGLIEEAKLKWFSKNHNAAVVSQGMLELTSLKGEVLPQELAREIQSAVETSSQETWDTLERAAGFLEAHGILDEEEISTLMDLDNAEEYDSFLERYKLYLARKRSS